MTCVGLPLFDWAAGKYPGAAAKVLLFPVCRQAGRVRAIARELVVCHGAAADAAWRRTARDLRDELAIAGVTESEIERQVRSIFDAVQTHIAGGAWSRDAGPSAA